MPSVGLKCRAFPFGRSPASFSLSKAQDRNFTGVSIFHGLSSIARWRRTALLIPFYCVSSHVPSWRAFHPPTCTAPHMAGGLPSPCRDALSGVIGVSPRSEPVVCCYSTTVGSGSQSSPRARYTALPLTPSTTLVSSTETGSLACHSGDAAAACARA